MLGPSINVVCHWSARMVDPRCPVTLRHLDVATYRGRLHVCKTSCFARFVCWQNDRHHAARFAFLLSAHPWALKLSALLPFCPFRPCILRVSSADGALPSVDSSPNTISHDLSLGQYSLRSNTVWPRNRQVKVRYRTQANRKQ